MIPDISRSGTPPIPPLAPSAYAEMLRAQRDLRDVLLARGSERDDDGDADDDAAAMYDSIDAAFPEGNQRTSGDGARETRDGARGREDASEYDELRGVRTTSAATVETATRSGNNMGDESTATATMMMGAARDLLGGGYWSGTASGSHTPSASVGGDETTTTTTTTATGSAEPSALHRVMVGKPPKGTGNYDKPSGDVVEPVKASTTGRAKVGWVRINTQGNVNRLSMEKTRIASLLRVPLRDLRVLEPSTADSYSNAVLCRERAIVVNLEQIKVLITSEEVIMTDSQTSTVTHFLPELEARLLRRKRLRAKVASSATLPFNLSAADLSSMSDLTAAGGGASQGSSQQQSGADGGRGGDDGSMPSDSRSGANANAVDEFPFEFVALEVALEMVCNSLEIEANKVELDAKPALEALRKRVDNVNLERVRRMKTRLVRITGRVSKVREEIQRYLDDDSDMRDMYLTRKAHSEDASAPTGTQTRGDRQQLGASSPSNVAPPRSPLGVHGLHVQGDAAQHAFFDVLDDDKDLQELEDLLETYFTHIDSTYRSLNGLNEYIDDLEDLIEIELDSQRNQLIKLELILTTATLSLTCFSVVVGIFGMNIKNNIETEYSMFLVVVILGTIATIGLFLLLLRVCRWYKLF
jgi:magnesium transporter